MKAFIRAELFNDDFKHQLRIAKDIFNMGVPGLGTAVFSWPSDTWAAEIAGFDKKYKYERKFLRGKKDYTYANSKGSRGVYLEWILESGHIYDIKRRISWSRCERFFCTVDQDGNIVKMHEKDVIECLKRRSALMCLPPPGNASLMCLTISPASMYRSAVGKTVR